MADKQHIYDLAYKFRKSKIWMRMWENDLFAINLPDDGSGDREQNTGFCSVMGRNGEHMAIAIYLGPTGFSSYRKLSMGGGEDDLAEVLSQDSIQCSMAEKEELTPEELTEVQAYCKTTGTPFRAPFPKFSRIRPYCFPYPFEEEWEWTAMETALEVMDRMGKRSLTELGIRSITATPFHESYEDEAGFGYRGKKTPVRIPLFSVTDGELKSVPIPLPPYQEEEPEAPTQLNELAIRKLKNRPQRGIMEADVFRVGPPVDGNPPFLPALLIGVTEEGIVLPPAVGKEARYDPNQLIGEFIQNLDGLYPKTIRYRTEEAHVLLEEFCRLARIRLEQTDEFENLDGVVESLKDGPDDETVDEILEQLSQMSVEELRMLPDVILQAMLHDADYMPPQLAAKIRKAAGRR
ncbi:MAG: hypothetical protein IJ083_05795 [Clostridia bacterium]|nr:hypothetical protein [Clostridia bacterium]